MTDNPDYRGFRITEIHAITGIGDDDEEAIPAFWSSGGPIPMIASDRVRLESLKQMAQVMADQTGKNFKVVKFSVREDIGEIKSRRSN
jgi:hypothetical protein